MIKEKRQLRVNASPEAVFRMAQTLGGETGWFYANLLWGLRGHLDLLAGGVGYRKGRRHPTRLHKGDAVDFWQTSGAWKWWAARWPRKPCGCAQR